MTPIKTGKRIADCGKRPRKVSRKILLSPSRLSFSTFAVCLLSGLRIPVSALIAVFAIFAPSAFAADIAATVRRAPDIRGGGTVYGSVQQLVGENLLLNGGATLTEDLLVPGTPTISIENGATVQGTVVGSGSTTPMGYNVTIKSTASLRNIITRTDAIALPVVAAPPSPTGTQNITINQPGQTISNWSVVRDLTVHGNAGSFTVQPGTYRELKGNSGATIVLGVAGSSTPSVYNLQSLTLNGNARLNVVGPVRIVVATGFHINGNAGTTAHPEWLEFRVSNGGVTLNGGALVYGTIIAPNGLVTINGQAELAGSVVCDRLKLNGGGVIRFRDTNGGANNPPVANAQTVSTPEDIAKAITLAGTDPDGNAITFQYTTPAHGTLSGSAPNLTYTPAPNYFGDDSFTFTVSDGIATSAAATVSITVTPVNDAPVAQNLALSTSEDTSANLSLMGSDEDGDVITYAVVTQPGHGSVSISGNVATYTPEANYHDSDSFTYTVTDSLGVVSNVGIVSVTVNPIQDTPVANPIAVTIDEDQWTTITLSGSDEDNDPLTFAVATQPQHGVISGTAPNLVYTPNANFHGTDSFTFTANDGADTSTPATVTITINPVNDAPVSASATLHLNEDESLNFEVTGTDVDDTLLSFEIISNVANGALTGVGPGFVYTPDANFFGTDTLIYLVRDSQGLVSAQATITLEVASVNDVPVANAQSVLVAEDDSVTFGLVAADVDGDPLTYTIITQPTNGTAVITGSDVTYSPAANFTGTDSLVFEVSDANGGVSQATVSITVTPVNDVPVVAAIAITANEDQSAAITLTGLDTEGDPLAYAIATQPQHGTLVQDGANVTYTPNPNYFGTDTFTYTATDGTDTSAPATVTITINPINDAPVADAKSETLPEDGSITVTLTGSDVENDALTFSIVSQPGHGTAVLTGANVLYTPAADFNGSDAIVIIANDGNADSAPVTIAFTVTPVNDAPVANVATLTLNEDTSAVVTLTGSDIDGDTLTYSIATQPAHGTVVLNGADVTYTPTANFHGADSFTFTVNDGTVNSAPALVTITVTPINDAPVANPGTLTLNEDSSAVVSLVGSDIDGDTLIYSIATQPAHGTVVLNGADATYTPVANYHGSDTFTFTVNDGTVDSAPALVSITVAPINDAPVASPGTLTLNEDNSAVLSLVGSDIDGDTLIYSIATQPAHGTVVLNGNLATYTPAANYYGSDSFTFVVNDGTVDSAPASVSMTINPVNDAPVADAKSETLAEDGNITVTLTGSDIENDALSYSVVSGPANGAYTLSGTTLTYTPAANFNGSDAIVIISNDGPADSAPATVAFTVAPVNDAPTSNPGTLTLNEDGSAVVTLSGTDIDGDTLTYAIATQPAHGTVVLSGTDATYTPAANYHGSDSFTFTVSDGTATSGQALVSITIEAVNDAPVVNAGDDFTVYEDTAQPLNASITDDAHPGSTLSVSWSMVSGPGTAVFGNTASASTIVTFDIPGSYVIRLTVSDGEITTTDDIAVGVTEANLPPLAQFASVQAYEDQLLSIQLQGTDPNGDQLVYTIKTQPANGTLSGIGANLFYTPNPDFFGDDTFQFEVTDPEGEKSTAAIFITVAPEPRSRTFTTTADFQEGELSLMLADQPPDQLEAYFDNQAKDYIWMPTFEKGTVCRMDIETGRVLSEHRFGPEGQPSLYPSRISVDAGGHAWIGSLYKGTLIKFAPPESRLVVDRNNNGVIDTSNGQDNLKPWTGGAAASTATAVDEAIILRIETGMKGIGHVSVDNDNNVWVGNSTKWKLYNGLTGELMREETAYRTGGRGGIYTLDGVIYSAGDRNKVLQWDTSGPVPITPLWGNSKFDSYDVASDSQQNLWVTSHGGNQVWKHSPSGELLGSYYVGVYSNGLTIDQSDHVWVSHSHCANVVSHNLPDGTFIGTISVPVAIEMATDRKGKVWAVCAMGGRLYRINPLAGRIGADGHTRVGGVDLITRPLNSSVIPHGDFVGTARTLDDSERSWEFSYDGIIPNAAWGPLAWNAMVYNDGKLEVSVATSNDGINFGAYHVVTLENPVPPVTGRYLRGRVNFVPAQTGEVAVLYDLSVGTAGYAAPHIPKTWTVSAGKTINSTWPDTVELKGALCRSDHAFTVSPTYTWTKVSGPGSVIFSDEHELRPKTEFSSHGVYVMRLTATLGGETHSSDVTLNLTPLNREPWVSVEEDRQIVLHPNTDVVVKCEAEDDGMPLGSTLQITWSKKAGPGTVTFGNPNSKETTANFSLPGVYLLEITATDSALSQTIYQEVRVESPCWLENPPGLVAWWQANCDASDHNGGNYGNMENGATFDTGKIAMGFKFDGVNDRVQCFPSPTLHVGEGDGISFEFWVKPTQSRTAVICEYGDSTTGGVRVTQVGDDVSFNFVDTNGLNHIITQTNVLSFTTFTHVVGTWNRLTGRAEIFINGLSRIVSNLGSFDARTDYEFFIGASRTGTQPFVGVIDELSIFNRAINPEEAYSVFSTGTIGKCPTTPNLDPELDAGTYDLVQQVGVPMTLNGTAADDGLPLDGYLTKEWSLMSGPGTATFADSTDLNTTVTFSAPGVYNLRLSVCDGAELVADDFIVTVGQYCTLEAHSEIRAWWPGELNAVDVINGNNGAFGGGKEYVAGKVGSALSFNGNSFVKVPASPTMNVGAADGLTIEMWVKLGPSTQTAYSLAGWRSDTESGGGVYYNVSPSSANFNFYLVDQAGVSHSLQVNSGFSITTLANQFTHVAATYDKTTGRAALYVNGVEKGSNNMGIFTPKTHLDFYMGKMLGMIALNGELDEVAIYATVLAPHQIDAIYQTGSTGKCRPSGNAAPELTAGPDKALHFPNTTVTLDGSASDDGLPIGGTLSVIWNKVSGPGNVSFANDTSAQTVAEFDAPGLYELELVGNDGMHRVRDIVLVIVGNPAEANNTSGMGAWWTGNQTLEDSINDHDGLGVYVNYVAGKVGSAMNFINTNSYVRVPASPGMNVGTQDGFTMEMWVKPSGASQTGYAMLGWQDGVERPVAFYYSINASNGVSLNFALKDQAGVTHTTQASSLTTSTFWRTNLNHVAASYNKITGLASIYYNGALVKTANFGSFTPRTDMDFYMGQAVGLLDFTGVMDEVSVYPSALTSADISAIYQAGAVGKALPGANLAPLVHAGQNQKITGIAETATMHGSVSDDGLPDYMPLHVQWQKKAGPGNATFTNAADPQTTVQFDAPGYYELELSASDGFDVTRDIVEVTVGLPCILGTDPSVVSWWTGNHTLKDVMHRNDGQGPFISYAPCKVGSGIDLTAANNFVEVPASPSLDLGTGDGFSIELWVKPMHTAGGFYPLLKWENDTVNGVLLGYANANLHFQIPDTNGVAHSLAVGGSTLASGGLYHVAATYDKASGVAKIYLNGVLKLTSNVGTFTPKTDLPLKMGVGIGWSPFTGILDEVTLYNRAITLAEVQSIYNAGATGKCHPPEVNTAPVVQAGQDRVLNLPETQIVLGGSAVDDALPVGSSLTYTWDQVSGPSTVTFANPQLGQITAYASVSGTYVLRLTVSDGEFSVSDEMTLTIPVYNQAPVVSAGTNATITFANGSVSLDGTVTDDGQPFGQTMVTTWSQTSGPGTTTFEDAASVDTLATFSAPGEYVLTLTANDTEFTSTSQVTITVTAPPVISLSSPANNAIVAPGSAINLTASATDPDGLVVSVEYFLNGTSIGTATEAPYAFSYPSLAAGRHSLTAVATDDDGFTTTSAARTVFAAVDPGTPPALSITTPDDGESIYAPTAIIGTANSPILDYYTLSYRKINGCCEDWVVFHTGHTPVTNGTLATIDPTLLVNGLYDLRLLAYDAQGRGVQTIQQVSLEGDMKVGHFTVAFEDLSIPLAGIPLRVMRYYDSRERCPGDFGYGWLLDVESIRLEKSAAMGAGWEMIATEGDQNSPSTFQLADSAGHTLTVRMPDGEVLKFSPKVVMDRPFSYFGSLLDEDGDDVGQVFLPPAYSQPLKLSFRARGGTKGASLKATGYKAQNSTSGTSTIPGTAPLYISEPLDGPISLATHENSAQDAPFVTDATGWELTTKDKRVFTFDEQGRLATMRDPQGNILSIIRNSGGKIERVTHSAGQEVVFVRNGDGFVTKVIAPNLTEVNYGYDAAGDLRTVHDRAHPVSGPPTTSFEYNTQHFLQDIFDGKGTKAAKNYYDNDGRLIRTVDANGKETIMTHNIAGRTETIRDRNGNTTVYQYDTRGNITRLVAADGTITDMTYHTYSDGRKSELKTSESITGMFTDENGVLVQKTLTTTYAYEDDLPSTPPTNDGLLRKLVDPMGHVTKFSYDANGNPLTVTDALNRTTTNTYHPNSSLLATTTDANGHVTSFTYDARGNVDKQTTTVTVVDAAGVSTVQTIQTDMNYDTRGYLVSMRDADGHLTTYVNDDHGNRLLETTTRTKNTVPATQVTLVTEHEYDANDRLIKTWDAEHPKATYPVPSSETVYDENGKVKETYDAERRKTEMFYTDRGELDYTRFPDGTTQRTEYDDDGRRTASIDRRGKKTQFFYDNMNRLEQTWFIGSGSDVSVHLSSSTYDSAGRVHTSTDANWNTNTMIYDNAGRRIGMINAKDEVSSYEYNAVGNLRFFTDAKGHTTEHVYDILNRRVKTILPATNVWTGSGYESKQIETHTDYDELGRRVAEYEVAPTDVPLASRRATRYVFDKQGRLSDVVQPPIFHDNGNVVKNAVTSYTYDELGNQLTQKDAEGRITKYIYDNLGRRVNRVLPGGQTESTTYNIDGTVDTHTDFNNSTTNYGYDNMNRLLIRTVNAGSGVVANNVSFTYTTSGRRQTMTDASGTTTYGYDSRDRLASKATPQGTLIYGYDDASNLTSITTNTPDGASMTYGHDELNRLDSVIDGNAQETTYAYDANGNLSGVGLPNGIISGYQYNAANRLTSLVHVNAGGTVASFEYGLNPTGHRREAVETGQGINMIAPATQRTRVWAYDNLWRLQNETLAAGQANANGSVSYGLDSVGNRLSRSSSIPGLISQSFSYNVNDRLVGNTYDGNGNTKTAPASQVVTTPNVPAPVTGTDQYNSSNQLTTRNAPNGDTVQLVYDGDGNKVRQITTRNGMTTTTTYLVDDMNPTGYAQVLEEKTNGSLTKVYTFGHDLISLDQFTAGNWNLSYYGYDGHGSVRYLTNALGQVTDTYDYDAFGELLAVNGTTPNSFLYCGEHFDADLGLYYLRARLMNPLTGRFWTADSYEGQNRDPASLHKYMYANANAVTYRDPSGHFSLVDLAISTSIASSVRLGGLASTIQSGSILAVQVAGLNVGFQLKRAAIDAIDRGDWEMAAGLMLWHDFVMGAVDASTGANDVVQTAVGVAGVVMLIKAIPHAIKAAPKIVQWIKNIPKMFRSGVPKIGGGSVPHLQGNVPDPVKWIGKGGSVSYKPDGSIKYTDWEGNAVTYSSDGYPMFKESGLVRQSTDIEMKGNYTTDFTDADATAPLGPKLPQNTWHHNENLTTMDELDSVIHNRFSHSGGVSVGKR